jgi:hypothetical protein
MMKTRGRRSRDTAPSSTDLTLTETYLETRARPRNGLLKNEVSRMFTRPYSLDTVETLNALLFSQSKSCIKIPHGSELNEQNN